MVALPVIARSGQESSLDQDEKRRKRLRNCARLRRRHVANRWQAACVISGDPSAFGREKIIHQPVETSADRAGTKDCILTRCAGQCAQPHPQILANFIETVRLPVSDRRRRRFSPAAHDRCLSIGNQLAGKFAVKTDPASQPEQRNHCCLRLNVGQLRSFRRPVIERQRGHETAIAMFAFRGPERQAVASQPAACLSCPSVQSLYGHVVIRFHASGGSPPFDKSCYQDAGARTSPASRQACVRDAEKMSDKFFFPAIIAFGLFLVFLAIQPGLNRLPQGAVSVGDMNYNRVVVEGNDLNRMVVGGQADVELIRGDGPAHLQIVTASGMLSDDPRLGPHFILAADIEVQFSGFDVAITVRAAPGEARGAQAMMVNYSTGRDGESGWKQFDLQPGFEDFVFNYQVPVKSGDNALDYLAIRPVTPDKTRSLRIQKVTFERGRRWAEVAG